MNLFYFLLGAARLIVIFVIGIHNGFVSRRNAAQNAFASLDANLQKRFDLIPALVATVQDVAAHERETLAALSQIRAASQTPRAHKTTAPAPSGSAVSLRLPRLIPN